MTRVIDTASQLGAAFRDARSKSGLTQQALAEAAGVSRRWLINLESGRGSGSEIAKVMATAHALGLSLMLAPAPEPELTETERELLALFDEEN